MENLCPATGPWCRWYALTKALASFNVIGTISIGIPPLVINNPFPISPDEAGNMGKGCGFPQTFQLLLNSYHRQSTVILRILAGHKGQELVPKDKLPLRIIEPPFPKIFHQGIERINAHIDLIEQTPLTVHITASRADYCRHLIGFPGGR